MEKYKFLKQVSILYIEDNEDVVSVTSSYLKEFCDEVYIAYNGKEGLDLYRSKKPSIIITDIAMPVMDGLEMSKIIREEDRDTPIVINSAFSDVALFTQAINIGVHDYILKPTDVDKLIESVYKNLRYTLTDIALKSHKKLMQSILDEMNDPIFLLELNQKVSFVNQSAKNMMSENICFKSNAQLDSPNSILEKNEEINKDFSRVFTKSIKEKKPYKTSYICEDEKGGKHYFDINLKPILDVDGNVYFVLKSMHDVTAHKTLQENLHKQAKEMEHLAKHDPLTSLENRVSLLKHLEEEIRNTQKFVVLFIDLDDFKSVNDTYGHTIGDLLLINVSKRLKNSLKEYDKVARLGGDEFCVVLKGLSNKETISKVTSKIIDTISEEFFLEYHQIYSTCSIGISVYPNDGMDSKELLKNADTAMYVAKTNGRNRFSFYEKEMNADNEKRLKLEFELREAVKNKEFEVYFQPQMNSQNNTLIGLEALVRWNHPVQGILPPDDFLPLAKNIGIFCDIDAYVMDEAIKSLIEFKKITDIDFSLSINISASKIHDKEFESEFKKTLIKYKCNPEWIELEITEDELMTDIEKVTPVFKKLKKLGVKVAIDDFGTGYSSLKYLKDLSVDRLKIDKSFIDDIEDANSALIVKTIISLGINLELSVIAEGVENEKQKLFLRENGCHEIQGYFYSKPIPKERVIEFLKKMDEKDL